MQHVIGFFEFDDMICELNNSVDELKMGWLLLMPELITWMISCRDCLKAQMDTLIENAGN